MKRLHLIMTLLVMVTASVWAREVPDSAAVAPEIPADPLTVTRPAAPAPRRTTPVDIDEEKPRMVMHYYDQHGEPLKEPVMFLATLDTVRKVRSKPPYPLYNGMNFGVNFGDLIFMAFGQKHASFDVWANVSLHNWFFPTLECGVGFANDTPDNQNFTYRTSPSFYAKVGVNYNFLYKSNPAYQVFLGLRAGFSSFSYDVTDISISNGYWDETELFSMKGLRSTSFYGEALIGLQVKIVKNFSLGWNARWHFKFHTTTDNGSEPWFVPGYGGSTPFSVAVNAIWTLPAPKKQEANTSE